MKIEAEQLVFELRPATPEELREEALQALWRRREREEAAKWTPEAYCRAWMQIDEDQWNQMPNYKRHNWLQRYLHEKERRECGFEMRTPGYHEAVAEESFQEAKRLAESWAVDIRKAFVERKPCPIRPEPAYESILHWAFMLACVPEECLGTEEIPSP